MNINRERLAAEPHFHGAGIEIWCLSPAMAWGISCAGSWPSAAALRYKLLHPDSHLLVPLDVTWLNAHHQPDTLAPLPMQPLSAPQ